ncbi:MAG: HPr family phosphocarrier protein [Hungatella sp.]
MVTWKYEIEDPEGFHARPASWVAMTLMKFQASVRMFCRENSADAKNILELMALGAGRKDILTVEIQGEDETEALEALQKTLVYHDGLNPMKGFR